MRDFYKYIIKNGNGTYSIFKNNERCGTYDDLRYALHDRDLLVDYDWDIGEVLAQDEKPNKYIDVDLPEWNKHIPTHDRYITKQKNKYKTYFKVQKTINGEQKCFGYFESYDDAVKLRDELEAEGWVKKHC